MSIDLKELRELNRSLRLRHPEGRSWLSVTEVDTLLDRLEAAEAYCAAAMYRGIVDGTTDEALERARSICRDRWQRWQAIAGEDVVDSLVDEAESAAAKTGGTP